MTNSEEEEEEEEEEEFYESFDRILSSSCSSTSASASDDDGDHRRRRHCHFPRFPPLSAASFDVWISEPSSVEERRRRLLQQLGLAGDPSLSRLKSTDSRPREADMGRSVSCDGLCPRPTQPPAAVIPRSRSDGAVDPSPVYNQQPQRQSSVFHRHRPSLGLPAGHKPPLAARPRSSPGIDFDPSDDAEFSRGDGEEDGDGDVDRRCMIKNLDTGKEFVVKEFREDGMWKKLREVGTGRNLTMEEFEMCVGRSPIVQELMRRQNVEEQRNGSGNSTGSNGVPRSSGTRPKRRGSWFRSIKNAAGSVVNGGGHHRERRSSDEKDTSSEKGGRRSSSTTDDSQDGHHGPERTKVRHYGKPHKELTGLFMSQEIKAHNGSIWSIKFSLDGRYLASAGEDCVIHVWQVSECERKGELASERGQDENVSCIPLGSSIGNGSSDPMLPLACIEGSHWEKKRRAKVNGGRKSVSSDQLMVPEHVFALSEKPVCSFRGHVDDVLDLSWSKSQYLLSSSMDKTVRLWHLSSNSCLKTFTHSDYVTCIQFNPVDDRYFISGSLDEKVRIWSIPERQVVDWNDLHEMVTAACYTPDGQGALVGSHKGSCHLYNTSDNKLLQKSQIDLKNRKKKSSHKKITGFQFAPGSSSEVIITSADSRIRVIDGVELVHKFKGFRNTNSQISACLTSNGKYVICASEDSHVYVWRYDAATDSRTNRSRSGVSVTQSYEHFHCRDVTVAVPWPSISIGGVGRSKSSKQNGLNGVSIADTSVPTIGHDDSLFPHYRCNGSTQQNGVLNTNTSHFGDRASATWPEEKLVMTTNKGSPQSNGGSCNGGLMVQSRPAWGMVIVTVGRGGQIRIFQNFGFAI